MTEWINPLVAVDVVLLRFNPALQHVEALLVERKYEPHKGSSAIPGVLIGQGETVGEAVTRTVETKCFTEDSLSDGGYSGELLDVLSNPERDPRARVISIANVVVVSGNEVERAGAKWVPLMEVLTQELPFDHTEILKKAREWAEERTLKDFTVTQELLGDTFDSATAIASVESIGGTVDPTNFARRMRSSGWVSGKPLLTRSSSSGRPPRTWTAPGGSV